MPGEFGVVDQFHRALDKALKKHYGDAVTALANGGALATVADPRNTGERYAREVGYIAALTFVFDICDEVERDLYGPKPGAAGAVDQGGG